MQARRSGDSPAASALARHEFDPFLRCAVDFEVLAYEEDTLDTGGNLGIHG